jgi:ABC-2 type transport system permease protein
MTVSAPTATAAPSTGRVPGAAAMLRAVVRRGLRDQRRALVGWGVPLSAMSALMALVWPSIEGSMNTLMANYPEKLKDAFNITAITNVEAYIDAEMLSFIVPLAVSFLAVRVVVRMLSGAVERRYLDIVLTVPLGRRGLGGGAVRVAASGAGLVLAAVTGVAGVAGVLVGADPSFLVLGRGMANVWPLAMLFAGLAVLACGRLHTGGSVTAVAAGTLVAMYVVDLVGKLADPVEPVRALSAFKYYGSAIHDGIDPIAFTGMLAVAALLAVAGALWFERRDVL